MDIGKNHHTIGDSFNCFTASWCAQGDLRTKVNIRNLKPSIWVQSDLKVLVVVDPHPPVPVRVEPAKPNEHKQSSMSAATPFLVTISDPHMRDLMFCALNDAPLE